MGLDGLNTLLQMRRWGVYYCHGLIIAERVSEGSLS